MIHPPNQPTLLPDLTRPTTWRVVRRGSWLNLCTETVENCRYLDDVLEVLQGKGVDLSRVRSVQFLHLNTQAWVAVQPACLAEGVARAKNNPVASTGRSGQKFR